MFDVYTEDQAQRIMHVVLLITHDCNLRCKYCYEHFKDHSMMSFKTAKSIIQREMLKYNEHRKYTRIEFACLGGEPLLNFPLIKDLVEWTSSIYRQEDYFFTVRTNGTVMTEEMKNWLEINKDCVIVGLSLDGLSEMNMANRKSCSVDIDFFRKNWPVEPVRVTLFPESIKYLYKTVLELKNRSIPFVVSPADGIVWPLETIKHYEEELSKLQSIYQDDFWGGVECGLFPYDPFEFFQNRNDSDVPYCGAYGNIICYDANGIDYPCHIFAPITIGKEKALRFREFSRDLKTIKIDPVCAGCEIRTLCRPCFGFHYKIAGDVGVWTERSTICQLRKMLAKVSAELFLKAKVLNVTKDAVSSKTDFVRTSMALKMIALVNEGER